MVDKVLKLTEMLQEADTHNIESILLYGPRGAGKSGLVGHISSLLKFTLVKVITSCSQRLFNELRISQRAIA